MVAAGDFGLADTGREERAAASMTLAAVSRAGGEDAGTMMLKCGSCGLLIASRSPAPATRYCPRCLARRHAVVSLRPLETVRR